MLLVEQPPSRSHLGSPVKEPSIAGTRCARHRTPRPQFRLLLDLFFPSTAGYADSTSSLLSISPSALPPGGYHKALGGQRGQEGPGSTQRCSQASDSCRPVAGYPKAHSPESYPQTFVEEDVGATGPHPRSSDSVVPPGPFALRSDSCHVAGAVSRGCSWSTRCALLAVVFLGSQVMPALAEQRTIIRRLRQRTTAEEQRDVMDVGQATQFSLNSSFRLLP